MAVLREFFKRMKRSKKWRKEEEVLREIPPLYPSSSIGMAIERMEETGEKEIPVVDPGSKRVLGEVSAFDLVEVLGGEKEYLRRKYVFPKFLNLDVREIMGPAAVLEKYSLKKAFEIITTERETVFYVKKGRYAGAITERDLLAYFGDRAQGKVKDYYGEGVQVTPGTKLVDVARIMARNRIHRVLVVSRGSLKGIISSRDVVLAMRGSWSEILGLKARDVLSEAIYVGPEDEISQAVELMVERGYGSLPVVEKKVLGILERDHILRKVI